MISATFCVDITKIFTCMTSLRHFIKRIVFSITTKSSSDPFTGVFLLKVIGDDNNALEVHKEVLLETTVNVSQYFRNVCSMTDEHEVFLEVQ